MATCIPAELIDDVKRIVATESSLTRNKKLTELFGGNKDIAKEINTLYEKSLLLKNQDTALEKFISNFTEIGQAQKQELKERIASRLKNRTERIQNEELLSIAQDIYNRKYKIDIPLEDIGKMNAIKREADSLKSAMTETLEGSPERMAYGNKIVELNNIVDNLKNPRNTMGIGETVKDILSKTGERFNRDKGITGNIGEAGKLGVDILSSAVYKSVQASMDASYAFRQGLKVLTTNPKAWAEGMVESFKPFQKVLSKEEQQIAADAFKARMVSHPLYEDAIKSKLGIGVIEEFFPTTLAEKVPAIGNIFKASNEAFTIFSQGSRMRLFEDFVNTAKKNGTDVTPELMKDFAKVANSVTGRGNWKGLESQANLMNKIFYSGKYIKSSVDTFFMPFDPGLSKEAKAEALKVSRNNLATIGALIATASMFTEVETDPRSSKFGKMKIGNNTWVDLTGGLGSYIVLASRTAKRETKSATTGKITELNSGKFNSKTTFDIIIDFLTNKTAPAVSTAIQVAKGQDFSGKKPTLGSVSRNLVTPISAGNIYETFSNNDSATALLATMFDLLGASQTDYNKFMKNKK